MAQLGYHFRLLLPTSEDTAVWQNAGFELYSDTTPVVLTDGQVVLEYASDTDAIKVCYHHSAPLKVLLLLEKAGLKPTVQTEDVVEATLPGNLTVRIEKHSQVGEDFPSKEVNSWLGFCDGLIVPVADAGFAQAIFENLGFFVLEATDKPFRRIDMTDGLLRISVQESATLQPTLLYACDLTPEAADELVHEVGTAHARSSGTSTEVYYVSINSPSLKIVVVNDFDL